MPASSRRVVTDHTKQGLSVDLNAGTDGPIPVGLTLNGGSVIRLVEMLPGKASPMHRSYPSDDGIVLGGRLELELDGGATIDLGPGDVTP